ncbi:hypothetical protein [Vibrio algarum]|uniref:Uncharacterized protein n=1 Tax=Vibrio algarum TaxID=3020714 RepID=A0ABT4YS44_9VIBR|nr:hypothetical protein [Vibrio sp. KJ40-1]MDB1124338.1 hypothetical protein [Vibrio sp. KJ40-1]
MSDSADSRGEKVILACVIYNSNKTVKSKRFRGGNIIQITKSRQYKSKAAFTK